VGDPYRGESPAVRDRALDCLRDGGSVVRVGPHGDAAGRLVHGGVGRGDDRRPARHRFDDRHPEPLEPRGVDGDRRAAVEARELLVGDEPEPAHARIVECWLLTPAFASGDGEQDVSPEQPVRVGERLQVLPRLERGDGEDVGRPEVGGRPGGREDGFHPGRRDADPRGVDAEQLGHVGARERRVDEDDVAGARGVRVLAAVHRLRPLRRPRGKANGNEVVDRRRANPGPLWGIHPVREVKDVEAAEQPLCRRMAGHAPGGADRVRGRQRPGSHLHVESRKGLADPARAPQARRRERDDLVRSGAGLDHPAEGASDVVPDPGGRVGERADVEGDPHGR